MTFRVESPGEDHKDEQDSSKDTKQGYVRITLAEAIVGQKNKQDSEHSEKDTKKSE